MIMVASERLDRRPMTVEALEALIAGDRTALEAVTGARCPRPLAPPPLTGDALMSVRDVLRGDPSIAPWWVRLIVLRGSGEAGRSIGFTGRPDDQGTILLGYSVYPAHQRQGIASEAAAALVGWAMALPGVARAAGLTPTGERREDPDEGPVDIWQRRQE